MARLDPTGVSRILTYIKTWITGLLSNKSDSSHTHSDYVPRSGGGVIDGTKIGRVDNTGNLFVCGGIPEDVSGWVELYGKDHALYPGVVSLKSQNSNSYSQLVMAPNGAIFFDNNGTRKSIAMQEDTVPRSGGAVMTDHGLYRNVNNNYLLFGGGTHWGDGAVVQAFGMNGDNPGMVRLNVNNGSVAIQMELLPNGTWTWGGTACQIVSDQRLKQQISNIDDKLLDAWEDVLPCQFKYNDAVSEKGDTARLHTGYVVQQIDEACKSHNLDISAYGLYCHEEYPERTEEVEVKQDDGSVIKETKVIEPAKEHYSLRYTEALIVECAYLRREVKRLSERLEKLEK